MSDLISRSALLERMRYRRKDMYKKYGANDPYVLGFCGGLAYVEQYPGVDAVPVVHARWVKAHGMMPPEYHHRKQCSMCGGWALQDYFGRERMSHYCPNCGAKMDGGLNEKE